MTTRTCTEKSAKITARRSGRLCALLLIAALMLSLTPSAFAADSGKLSVTPKVLLNDDVCYAKILKALSPEENAALFEAQQKRSEDEIVSELKNAEQFWFLPLSFVMSKAYLAPVLPDRNDDWERFVIELKNKRKADDADSGWFDDYEYFEINAVKINGIQIEAYMGEYVDPGETKQAYLSVNKSLMALAGIQKIQSLEIAFLTPGSGEEGGARTKWVKVSVKDSRTSPYAACSMGAKSVQLFDYGYSPRLTLLGIDQRSPAVLLYFKVESKDPVLFEELDVYCTGLNGESGAREQCLSACYLEEQETLYYMGYLINETGEAVETIDLKIELCGPFGYFVPDADETDSVHAEIGDANMEAGGAAVSPSASYTDEELLALAQEAEASMDNYSTVSNQKVALQLPKAEYYLSEAKRLEVKFTRGGSIYIMPKPASGNGVLGKIEAGTEVTVIAERKGFYFFIADDGRMGWNGKDYFIKPQG